MENQSPKLVIQDNKIEELVQQLFTPEEVFCAFSCLCGSLKGATRHPDSQDKAVYMKNLVQCLAKFKIGAGTDFDDVMTKAMDQFGITLEVLPVPILPESSTVH